MKEIEKMSFKDFKRMVDDVYAAISSIPAENFKVNLDEILKGPPFLEDKYRESEYRKDKEAEKSLGKYILRHRD